MSRFMMKFNTFLDKHPIRTLTVMTFALNLVIEALGRKNPLGVFVHIFTRPHLFLLNALIIFSTLSLVLLVRRRVFLSVLISVLWLICGIVNFATLTFRTTPFSARDFLILGAGIQIADVYFTTLQLILFGLTLPAIILCFVFLYIKAPKCARRPKFKKAMPTAIALIAVMFVVFRISSTQVALAANYDSINDIYEDCGFVFCFASSIFDNGINKPENYSSEKVSGIISSMDVKPASDSKPNIIVLQLESFFDPSLIKGLKLLDNPIPNFTAMRDSGPSGYLRVPVVGGGTVNTEFEVLTGMSVNYFGVGEYPYESVLRDETCESVAYDLKDLGYTSSAIHNYDGSFYGRNEVYPNLGFDAFTSVEYMTGSEHTEKGWTKDAVLKGYILDAMESTEGSDLVFAVSVQCHGKYPKNFEDKTVPVDENTDLGGVDPAKFQYYLAQLRETDKFLGDLIAALKKSSEEVVLLVYGDHLPTLDISKDDLSTGSIFTTQYAIWSSRGILGSDKDLSAYQLTSRLYELVGIHGGILPQYHLTHMGKADYLDGLSTLQYDILYGDKLAYGAKGPYKRTDIRMGLGDIKITGIVKVRDNDGFYVTGTGFTEYSVIYVDGELLDTEFKSDSLLYTEQNLDEGKTVAICQLSAGREILSFVDYKY